MKGMCSLMQVSMTRLVKAYSLLASFTFKASTPLNEGMPFGHRLLRSGRGAARLRPDSKTGISLALLEVPQGGASMTPSTFPCSSQEMTWSCVSFLQSYVFAMGPLIRFLSTM